MFSSYFIISLLKNSLEYHVNGNIVEHEKGRRNSNSEICLTKKQVAMGVTDYCAGAGMFLAVTGATKGVGAVVGIKAGIKTGVAASGIAATIGGLLGLW